MELKKICYKYVINNRFFNKNKYVYNCNFVLSFLNKFK